MGKQYTDRIMLIETSDRVELTIAVKKYGEIMIFITLWVAGLYIMAIIGLAVTLKAIIDKNIMVLPFLIWTFIAAMGATRGLRIYVWLLKGKEIIKIAKGVFSTERKGDLFFKSPIPYDVDKMKNLRLVPRPQSVLHHFRGSRATNFYGFVSPEVFQFEYCMKKVKFGLDIDQAEANNILQILLHKVEIGDGLSS